MAHYESCWEFEMDGDPLPCEETELYTAKWIKDRLKPEIIGYYYQYFEVDFLTLIFIQEMQRL